MRDEQPDVGFRYAVAYQVAAIGQENLSPIGCGKLLSYRRFITALRWAKTGFADTVVTRVLHATVRVIYLLAMEGRNVIYLLPRKVTVCPDHPDDFRKTIRNNSADPAGQLGVEFVQPL